MFHFEPLNQARDWLLDMRWVNCCAERTKGLRNCAHGLKIVYAPGGVTGNAAGRVQLDVGRDIIRIIDHVSEMFSFFERELLDCGFNLSQIVDAGGSLRFGAGMHEAGNSDCRQQANDGHNNQDFHQRESRPKQSPGGFQTMFSFGYTA